MSKPKTGDFLDTKGKGVLLYHTDLDGICSAAMLLRFYPDLKPVPREGPISDDRFIKSLISYKPDLVVIVDLPLDQEWKKIDRLQRESPGTRIILIDHHVITKDMNSDRVIHINPRFRSNAYIATSSLVYNLLKEVGKPVQPLVWIAAIGVIGDYAFEDCRELLKECAKLYPELGKDLAKSALGSISQLLMSAVILDGTTGVEKGLDILLKASGYRTLQQSKYLTESNKKVSKEIDRITKDFKKKAREYPELDLYIYTISSKLNIVSTISTMTAAKNPDKMILIIRQEKQYVKVSARYQAGDVNLNDLIKFAVDGIGSGGGHEKAAGAVVNRKDWPEFKKRLMQKLTELKAR